MVYDRSILNEDPFLDPGPIFGRVKKKVGRVRTLLVLKQFPSGG